MIQCFWEGLENPELYLKHPSELQNFLCGTWGKAASQVWTCHQMLATNSEQANSVTLQGMPEVDSESPCKTLASSKAILPERWRLKPENCKSGLAWTIKPSFSKIPLASDSVPHCCWSKAPLGFMSHIEAAPHQMCLALWLCVLFACIQYVWYMDYSHVHRWYMCMHMHVDSEVSTGCLPQLLSALFLKQDLSSLNTAHKFA